MSSNPQAGNGKRDLPPGENPFEDRSVGDVATTTILSCAPDAPLEEVAWMMAVNRVHALVVLGGEEPEPPIVADNDLVSAAQSGHFHELSAADIAGTESVSVGLDESLGRAAQLLAEHNISHLIVRDHRQAPVGIVSNLDLAAVIAGRA